MQEVLLADDALFGQLVRKHRSMLGLTRQELAARVGCSAVTIRKIEAGERRPSRQMAGLLADHLVRGKSDRAALLAAARFSPERDPGPRAPRSVRSCEMVPRRLPG